MRRSWRFRIPFSRGACPALYTRRNYSASNSMPTVTGARLVPKFKVLITDYAWPDVSIERETLAAGDAELIVAEKTNAESLAKLAVPCDAIMTNWAKVPAAVIGAAPNCKIVSRLGI